MIDGRERWPVQSVENAEIGQNHHTRCRRKAGMQSDNIYRLAEFIQIDVFLQQNGINAVPDIWLNSNRRTLTIETDISL